jgi:hypothetical protein
MGKLIMYDLFCNNCKIKWRLDTNFCGHCGKNLKINFCDNCGTTCHVDKEYCIKCEIYLSFLLKTDIEINVEI